MALQKIKTSRKTAKNGRKKCKSQKQLRKWQDQCGWGQDWSEGYCVSGCVGECLWLWMWEGIFQKELGGRGGVEVVGVGRSSRRAAVWCTTRCFSILESGEHAILKDLQSPLWEEAARSSPTSVPLSKGWKHMPPLLGPETSGHTD